MVLRSSKQQVAEYERFMRWWLTQDWDGSYSDVAWDSWWEASHEMRTENERLTLADKQWADHVKRLVDESDALRAEVERQERRFREAETEWVERFEQLEAESQRLQAQVAAHHTPGFVCQS
jgi:hypothetical protein